MRKRYSKGFDISLCKTKHKKIHRDFMFRMLEDRGVVVWSHRGMRVVEKECVILILCNLLDPKDPHKAFRAVLAQLNQLVKGFKIKFGYQGAKIVPPEDWDKFFDSDLGLDDKETTA